MKIFVSSLLLLIAIGLGTPLTHAEIPVVPPANPEIILTAAEKSWLAAHRTVRVRISDAYPPFEFFADNRYQGMAYDYLTVVGKRLGIEFQPATGLTWTESLSQLKGKSGIDLILCITHTAERESSIVFTRDYLSFPHVIFSRKDGHFIAGLKDLAASVVAVERGFVMKEWLQRDIPGIRILEVSNSAAAMQAVSLNKADAFIQNLAVGTYLIDKLGLVNIKVAAPTPYGSDNLAMGVRNDWPELAGLIDKALASLTPDEHRAIHQRWLTVRFEHGVRPIDIVKWAGAVAGLALIWILLLRRMVKARTAALREEIERRYAVEEDLRERNEEMAVIEEELRQQLDDNFAAQEIISRTNLLLQAVMDNSFQLQGLLSPEGVLLDANRAALDFIGCGKDEVCGRNFWETPWWSHDPALQEKLRESIKRAAGGEFVRFESTHPAMDGSLHTVDFSLKAIHNDAGQVIYLIPEGRDITERKQAETALQREKQFVDTVIESLPVIFYVRAADGFVRWNRLLQELTGLPADELQRSSQLAFVIDEDREYVGSLAAQCLNEGYAEGQARFRSPQGIRNLFITGKRMVLDDVPYIVGAAIDITEKVQAENDLRASEARLQLYFQRLPIGAIVWGTDYRVLQWNPAAERIFGYTEAEAIGRTVTELIVPEHVIVDLDKIWQSLLTGSLDAHSINENRTRYGMIVTCAWTNTPLHDRDGKVIGVISVVEDITERAQMELALRESEERFRQIFNQNDDAIFIIDLKTLQVVDANPAALTLYGVSRRELDRLIPETFINRNDLQKFIAPVLHSRTIVDKAISFKPNGEKIIISLKAQIIHLRNERAVLCSIRDKTEKFQLEEKIRTSQAKLIQANKMSSLGMLVSGVAHEINNPNQCIAVNAGVLANIWRDAANILRQHCDKTILLGNLPWEDTLVLAPQLLGGITESSQRIGTIVANMRDFVKSGQGGQVNGFDVNKAVAAASSILWHNIQKYTDNFSQELADHLPLAHGNSLQVEQVIINLIMNALQALPARSHGVSVSTAFDEAAGVVVITVMDAGRGMDPNTLQRLAEPFFTTREAEGGTGLGLYISTSLIKDFHGTLDFDSTPGEGTTATIRLPAADSSQR